MIKTLLRKLGFHVHEWKPTRKTIGRLPAAERWYWEVEECDCGATRVVSV